MPMVNAIHRKSRTLRNLGGNSQLSGRNPYSDCLEGDDRGGGVDCDGGGGSGGCGGGTFGERGG